MKNMDAAVMCTNTVVKSCAHITAKEAVEAVVHKRARNKRRLSINWKF